MAFPYPMIAAGHNNEEGLSKWKDLNQCLFRSYNRFVLQEWNSSESRELGADKRFKRIGRPWTTITFPILYEEDFKYIIDNFTLGQEDGLVTVTAYDRDNMEWKNFNARLVLPEDRNFDVEVGYYVDIEIEFRELVEI